MHWKGAAFKLAVAVTATALIMTGCTAAATTSTANTTAMAAAGGASAAGTMRAQEAAGGEAHIMVYSINSDGPFFRVILTGAVGDYGPAVTVYPDGRVDPRHTSDVELKLTHGSFRLRIASIDRKIVSAFGHFPANPRTCSGTVTVAGTAPVVADSGTGWYRGISGSFRMTVTIDEVDVKPVCNGTSKFLWQVILLAGAGTVSF